MAIPGRQERGYFAEISWREGEKFRGALLSIARADVELSSEMTWVVRHQQRGILHLEEDKTWQDLITSLENSQRSASEASAQGRLRAMASGQAVFAAYGGGGFAGDLRCLLAPKSCGIESTVGFVDDSFRDAERSGYRFTLHPGEPLGPKVGGLPVLKHYAYTAEPVAASPSWTWLVFCKRLSCWKTTSLALPAQSIRGM